ncbi:MAG: S8 family peptidase [Ectothiorhodospiraceae bacterium]|nr:S8 family peptidase [Ectothiorhodospiraceae bacterium]
MGYWEKYTKKKNYKFPWGLGPLRELFKRLHSIRYWDTEDRLRKTGLLDDWRYRVKVGQEILPVEIELWCRNDISSRVSAESRVRRYVQNAGGVIKQSCVIEEINYHALLTALPVEAVTELLDKGVADIELLRCDEIMYFRPSGQCMAPVFTECEDRVTDEQVTFENNVDEIINDPTVALLDGLPLENHEWIKDYVIVDDPDGWSDNYVSSDQVHGTGMASLIIRGDMGNSDGPIPRKLYCRPIMQPFPAGFNGETREKIPDDTLPIDILHRAVRRIFEPEAEQPAIAPSVKIINLSIADPNRLFDKVMSPWAKLIDYLSEKYKVIFVLSAGNHLHDIELGITNKEFSDLSPADKEAAVLKGVSATTHERRLMSPAESINAITVAAYHHDEVDGIEFYNQINPYPDSNLPSTINPVTWGKKRSVKPEILLPGGRATYRLKSFLDGAPAILEVLTFNKPPGQKVASPADTGSLSSFAHTFGTSNSAALGSRRLCFLYETVQDLYLSPHGNELSHEYENVILKALICHGASHTSNFARIEEVLKEPDNSQRFKSISPKYLGYGNVDEDRIHGCLDNQATIIQCGKIKQDDVHVYKFKLPDSLNAKPVNRRLIITLAWLSPINPRNMAYRMAHLFFEPVTGDKDDNHLDIQNREVDWQMVRNGTIQHEVLSGGRATAYASGTNLEIVIQCKGQAGAKA